MCLLVFGRRVYGVLVELVAVVFGDSSICDIKRYVHIVRVSGFVGQKGRVMFSAVFFC